MPKKRLTVDLSEDLYKKLKLLCYTEGLTLGDTIRNCLEEFCEKNEADMIKIIDERSGRSKGA